MHNRKDLTGEHLLGDLGQLILMLVFLGVWITDSFVFHYSTFLSKRIPLPIRLLLAFAILWPSWVLAKNGLKTVFGEVRSEPCVIRKGVFKIVRHPIYLGCVLFYLGLLIATLSLSAAVVWLIIIGFYLFISRHEEHLLRKRFGKAYDEYMHEVPMLIPRIIKRKSSH
jgi:protein-S-isoprenylcysteine O-methyltransferase Ste14